MPRPRARLRGCGLVLLLLVGILVAAALIVRWRSAANEPTTALEIKPPVNLPKVEIEKEIVAPAKNEQAQRAQPREIEVASDARSEVQDAAFKKKPVVAVAAAQRAAMAPDLQRKIAIALDPEVHGVNAHASWAAGIMILSP